MDPKTFYSLIENPEKISSKELNELSDILVAHPYFSSGHLLFALGHIERKSPGFEKKVQEHSIYIKNKKRLLNHYFDQKVKKEDMGSNFKNDESKKHKIEPQTEVASKSELENNDAKEQVAVPQKPSEKNKSIIKNQEKQIGIVQEKAKAKKDVVNTPKEDSKLKSDIKPKDTPSNTSQDKKEAGDLADRVMASLAQMKKDRERGRIVEGNEKILKTPEPTKPAEGNSKKASKDQAIAKSAQPKKSVAQPDKRVKPSEDKPKETGKKGSASVKKEPIKRVVVSPETINKQIKDSKTDKKDLQKKSDKPESVRLDHKLIDEFIASDIKIKPVENPLKEEKIEDLSRKSTTFHSHLISENLANIFEKQGKHDKAKVIYQQLQLKYPEKKAYFAAKIKNLDY